MPDESAASSPDSSPPYDPTRRVATGLAGETTGSLSGPTITPRTDGGTLLPSSTPMREVIGDFEVLAKLGQGGMGAVYRARQISLDRQVALKILPASLEADADFVSRFQREARVAASLSHGNLVKVYAAGQADGCHYIAMELIEGETLGQWLKRGPLPPLEALRICADVAHALAHGWSRAQLIHRDIKPGNIFLSIHGDVKVGDLGLAKTLGGDTTGLTQTGTAMGTPHYISPEQARGDRDVDFRSDIYSLGCTLYQMLTGRTPYEGRDPVIVLNHHINSPPPAILKVMPSCPIPLARLVGKMLKKIKRERHATYEELLANIESVRALFDPSLTFTPPPPAADPDATLLQTPATPASRPATQPTTVPVAPPPKSKTPLYAGVAAIVILPLIAFFAWPKKEKLTKAEIYAQQRAAERQADGSNGAPGPAASAPLPVPTAPRFVWRNALTEEPFTRVLAPLTPTAEGYDLPADNHWRFPAQPLTHGAVRWRGIPRASFAQFSVKHADGVTHVLGLDQRNQHTAFLMLVEKGPGILLRRGNAPSSPEALLSRPCEVVLIRAAGRLRWIVNGEVLLDVTDPKPGPAQFALNKHAQQTYTTQAVEYLSLEGASEAEVQQLIQSLRTSGAASSTALAAQPAPIKLWDSPDKLPKAPGISWEDGALRLDGKPMRYGQPISRDAILRASVRMNADAQNPAIGLRNDDRKPGGSFYILQAEVAARIFRLTVVDAGQGTKLQVWPFPKTYGPDDWIRMELRMVGENITATVDGQKLGSITDTSRLEPGGALLFATANGYFRDIEYVPLDGASAPAASTAAAPRVIKIATGPDDLPKTPSGRTVANTAWADDALRLGAVGGEGGVQEKSIVARDAILRARVRLNPEASGPQLCLRAVPGTTGGNFYRLAVATGGPQVSLFAVVNNQAKQLSTWKLDRPTGATEWMALELRCIGNQITAVADGRELGTVTDDTLSEPGGYQIFTKGEAYFRDIEYVQLDPWIDWVAERRSSGSFISHPDIADEGPNLHIKAGRNIYWQEAGDIRDGRVRTMLTVPQGREVLLEFRSTPVGQLPRLSYQAGVGKDGVKLQIFETSGGNHKWKTLGQWAVPAHFDLAKGCALEASFIGSRLTVSLNGREIGSLEDTTLPGPGGVGMTVPTDARLRSFDLQNLDSATAPAKAAVAWQPLIPVEKWQLNVPGQREYRDGLLHFIKATNIDRTATSPDGAIRAVLRHQSESRVGGVQARWVHGVANYSLQLIGARQVALRRNHSNGPPAILGTFDLPQPLQVGERLTLELRVVGTVLTGLVNGQPVLSAKDDQITEPGDWSIIGHGAVFESAEYQPLPPASAP